MTDPQPAEGRGPLSLSDIEPLYREHWWDLHRVAARLVGPVARTEWSRTCSSICCATRTCARGSWAARPRPGCRRIARRKSLELLRRRGRELPSENAAEGLGAPDPDWGARELVEKFMHRHVPEAQRRFFTVRFLDRCTQVEAATLLGIARSTLEGWEHKLTEALRKFIMEDG